MLTRSHESNNAASAKPQALRPLFTVFSQKTKSPGGERRRDPLKNRFAAAWQERRERRFTAALRLRA